MNEAEAQAFLADHIQRGLGRHGIHCFVVGSLTFCEDRLVVEFLERAHSSTGQHVPVAVATYVLAPVPEDVAMAMQQ